MIRFRRAVQAASGGTPSDFVGVWKFRVVVTCPPGETVTVTPVRESSLKDPFTFGPGDSGWISFDQRYTAIRVAKGSGATAATVDVWWADEQKDEVYSTGSPIITSPVGSVLYDSGSVAAGAAIDSGVLDLSTVGALEVIVDNTAGTAIRDLSLLSYLANGATLIDTVLLRRCGFGTAPTGATHAPGAIRGLVSPNPPGGTTGSCVLYDVTSAANTPLDTGVLVVEDMESVHAIAQCSAGTTTVTPSNVLDDGTTVLPGVAGLPAAAIRVGVVWNIGGGGNAASGNASFGIPPPRRINLTTTAAGAGNTCRLTVTGKGRVPGTFSHPMALPTRAKVTLGAGGAGAARLTLIAR